MRILLHSRAFFPQVGGVEQSTFLLARTLTQLRHEVVVATDTPSSEPDQYPFRVMRRPSFADLVRAARGADIVHANGFSLTTLPVALAARRPLIWTHAGYQAACLNGNGWHQGTACGYALARCVPLMAREWGWRRTGRQLVRHRAGRAALHLAAANVCVSDYVRQVIRAPRAVTIYNAADVGTFAPANPEIPAGQRRRVAFVGRLVTEKGLPVLLRAVAQCAGEGCPVEADIYGTGPEEQPLRRLAAELGVERRVAFRGVVRGKALAEALHGCAGLVVPSTWDEAFGIVAAEAMACGRVPLVSACGGLPEVVAPLEVTFPGDDHRALAGLMRRVVTDLEWRSQLEARLPPLAARFTPDHQAREYLRVYEEAAGRRGTAR